MEVSPLVDTLRRQLMENNYDYQSGDTDAGTTTPQEQARRPTDQYQDKKPYGRFQVVGAVGEVEGSRGARPRRQDSREQSTSSPRDNIARNNTARKMDEVPALDPNLFKVHQQAVGLDVESLRHPNSPPQFRVSAYRREENQKPEQVVAKNDLLYYVDDNRLRRTYDGSAPLRNTKTPLPVSDALLHDVTMRATEVSKGDSFALQRVNYVPQNVLDALRHKAASQNMLDPPHTILNTPKNRLNTPQKDFDAVLRKDILDTPQNTSDVPKNLLDTPQYMVDALVRQDTVPHDGEPQRTLDVDQEELYPHDDDITTPKVKYKLLKVPERDPTRRGGVAVHRFLEERGVGGVALISLDHQPFPQFQLPRARRQYMHHSPDELQQHPTDYENDDLLGGGNSDNVHRDV